VATDSPYAGNSFGKILYRENLGFEEERRAADCEREIAKHGEQAEAVFALEKIGMHRGEFEEEELSSLVT
jgi:hypothetical protein